MTGSREASAFGWCRLSTGRFGLVVLFGIGGLGLSGCGMDNYTARHLSNPETRHEIAFSKRREVLDLEIPFRGASLSSFQRKDVQSFVEGYKRRAVGVLTLTTPSTTRGHREAQRSVGDIRSILAHNGLDPEALRYGRHRSGRSGLKTVRLAYTRPVAQAPECGDWPENVGENRERLPFENFGCATQRNLAKMVANSRDLVEPQPESPRSSERRSVTWSEYVKGGDGDKEFKGAKPTTK